jgi:magnesium chelatase subunit I
LPVTLPINATDDRVLGGWELNSLMRGELMEQPGLLEEAGEKGMLYIDEVNLLDDHVVNIILDVASTGVLNIQREALNVAKHLSFGLVGTMNPEEGGLRPQLLDRFGLMVTAAELGPALRRQVIATVLRFEEERLRPGSDWLRDGRERDDERRVVLEKARRAYRKVEMDSDMVTLCAEAASCVKAVGHRGELVTAFAARALAALEGAPRVEREHLRRITRMTLRHRRAESVHGGGVEWSREELHVLDGLLA